MRISDWSSDVCSSDLITVNGKRVNIPSYQVQDGDVIQVKAKSRELPLVLQGVESPERDLPDYIEVDHNQMKATYIREPKLADVPYPVAMEPHLVIEYYSLSARAKRTRTGRQPQQRRPFSLSFQRHI